MLTKLRLHCETKEIPLYVVAGESCLSAAFMILVSGDKSFCDTSSLVGAVGAKSNLINANRFLKNVGIDPILVSTDEYFMNHSENASSMLLILPWESTKKMWP